MDSLSADAPGVSVAILNVDIRPKLDHLLRVLRVRPCPSVVEVFGVGDAAGFPADVRVLPASSPAAAKTLAAREARGEFVLLLSADAVCPPASIEAAVAVMRGFPRCALATPLLLYESGRMRPTERSFPSLAREASLSASVWMRWEALARRALPRPGGAFPRVDWTPMLCAVVRRRAAAEVGAWEEGFRFGFEDADWMARAARLGWEARVAMRVFAHHLPPWDRVSRPTRAMRLAFEHSVDRWLSRNLSPVRAALYRVARRLRHRLIGWIARAGWVLALGRHEFLRDRAEAARWVLEWHRQGRPAVDLPPLTECGRYGFDLW